MTRGRTGARKFRPRGAEVLVCVVALALGCGASPTSSSSAASTSDDDAAAAGSAASSTSDNDAAAACYPDNDGINGGEYTFVLTVDDTGFSKTILTTQNDAVATVMLTNMGTTPHGFMVGCTSVLPAYPDLPAGCPTVACFPSGATIPPLAPGASQTITFDTPTPDGHIYPFKSTEPADSTVPGLNNGQWVLM